MLYRFIVPLGITTVISMLITAFLGLRILKIQAKKRLKLHKTMALLTVILALLHGGIVIYLNYLQ